MMYLLNVKKVSQFFIFALFLTSFAHAQEKPAAKNQEPAAQKEAIPKNPPGESTFKERVIRNNIQITKKIDSLAENIDLFFAGGERLTDEKNKTSLRFTYFAHQTEGEDFANTVRTDFALRLPNTEENWSLKFSSEDDEEFNSLSNNHPGAAPRRERYGVSAGLVKKLGNFDVTFRPGFKVKNPMETSYILSAKNRVVTHNLGLAPRIEFFADSVQGTGQSTEFNFDYEFNYSWVAIWRNEEKYLDLPHQFSTLHGPGLLYKYSDRVGYATTFDWYFLNKSDNYHLESYTLSFSRRQEVWRKILFFEVSPSWTWAKSDHFTARGDLAVSVDFLF
jgi:hypothetical protein